MAGNALREVFARFGIEFDARQLVTGNAAIDGGIAKLREFGSAIAGAAIVVGIRNFTEATRSAAVELDNASMALGLNTEQLQAWRLAAAGVGVQAEQMTPAIQAVRRNADAAAHGGAGMAADFRRLGISTADLRGPLRDTNALLLRVAQGTSGIENPTQRAAILMRLMGEQGARLGPLFAQGAEGVQQALAEIEELGGGLSEDAIESARELTHEEQRLDTALLGIRSRIAVFVLPVVSRLVEGATGLASAFNHVASRGYLVETMLGVVGVAVTALGVQMLMAAGPAIIAWLGAAAPFILLGIAVGAAILTFEDLWISFTEGHGVFMDLAVAMDEWAAEWGSTSSGPAAAIAGVFEFLKGIIVSVVAQVGALLEATGLIDTNPWANIVENIGGEGDATSADAQRIANERRSSLGAAEFLIPDSFERWMAVTSASSQATQRETTASRQRLGDSQVTQSIRIDRIDASGMDGPQAQRVIQTAFERAMAGQHDDTIDTLATPDTPAPAPTFTPRTAFEASVSR